MKKHVIALAVSLLLLCAAPALAQAPALINFQGKLTDANLAPVDGDIAVVFSIYDDVGSLLWSELHENVAVKKAIFNALLGNGTPNAYAIPAPPYPPLHVILAEKPEAWLEVQILDKTKTPLQWETMSPRQRLVSVAYSLHAQTAVDVPGMDITPRTVTIPAYGQVIDSAGRWTGADINWSQMIEVPTDLSDGKVAWTELTGKPTDLIDDKIAWGELINKPADLADGQIKWSEVKEIPAGFADNKDDGILTETDPNVPASIKDGISWGEVSNIPAGFADGIDHGLTSETDPQVGSISTNSIPKWNGSQLVSSGSLHENGNGSIGVGTTSPSTGLKLDIEGKVGASEYCDSNGNNCFAPGNGGIPSGYVEKYFNLDEDIYGPEGCANGSAGDCSTYPPSNVQDTCNGNIGGSYACSPSEDKICTDIYVITGQCQDYEYGSYQCSVYKKRSVTCNKSLILAKNASQPKTIVLGHADFWATGRGVDAQSSLAVAHASQLCKDHGAPNLVSYNTTNYTSSCGEWFHQVRYINGHWQWVAVPCGTRIFEFTSVTCKTN